MNKMQRTYKVINFPPLTDEQKQEIDCLAAMKDEDIEHPIFPKVQATEVFTIFSPSRCQR